MCVAKEKKLMKKKSMKKRITQTFLKTVNTTIQHGAKDKEEAIKWILELKN